MISRSRRSRIPILLSLLFKVLFYLSSSSYFFLPNCLIRSRQSSIEKLNRIESFQRGREALKGRTKSQAAVIWSKRRVPTPTWCGAAVQLAFYVTLQQWRRAAPRHAASSRALIFPYLCAPRFSKVRVCVCVFVVALATKFRLFPFDALPRGQLRPPASGSSRSFYFAHF